MRTPWNAIHVVKQTSIENVIPRYNKAHLPKPSTIPRRPLRPNTFRPPIGQKQVYLPNFVLALVPTSPHLPPNYASFITPLWFNKLDIKDYLFHVYKLQVLSVRSYVIQSKVKERGHMGSRRFYRPRSRKKMTVELIMKDSPERAYFQWPEVPDNLEDFGNPKEWDGISRPKRARDKLFERKVYARTDEAPPEDAEEVRKQALQLRKNPERFDIISQAYALEQSDRRRTELKKAKHRLPEVG